MKRLRVGASNIMCEWAGSSEEVERLITEEFKRINPKNLIGLNSELKRLHP